MEYARILRWYKFSIQIILCIFFSVMQWHEKLKDMYDRSKILAEEISELGINTKENLAQIKKLTKTRKI